MHRFRLFPVVLAAGIVAAPFPAGACRWREPARTYPASEAWSCAPTRWADGDTLTADFTGQATPTSTPGVLSIVETATITGGTGRFAHATGSFVCERLFDTVAGTTDGSFEGTIGLHDDDGDGDDD